jgi:hypothetical protein
MTSCVAFDSRAAIVPFEQVQANIIDSSDAMKCAATFEMDFNRI